MRRRRWLHETANRQMFFAISSKSIRSAVPKSIRVMSFPVFNERRQETKQPGHGACDLHTLTVSGIETSADERAAAEKQKEFDKIAHIFQFYLLRIIRTFTNAERAVRQSS